MVGYEERSPKSRNGRRPRSEGSVAPLPRGAQCRRPVSISTLRGRARIRPRRLLHCVDSRRDGRTPPPAARHAMCSEQPHPICTAALIKDKHLWPSRTRPSMSACSPHRSQERSARFAFARARWGRKEKARPVFAFRLRRRCAAGQFEIVWSHSQDVSESRSAPVARVQVIWNSAREWALRARTWTSISRLPRWRGNALEVTSRSAGIPRTSRSPKFQVPEPED